MSLQKKLIKMCTEKKELLKKRYAQPSLEKMIMSNMIKIKRRQNCNSRLILMTTIFFQSIPKTQTWKTKSNKKCKTSYKISIQVLTANKSAFNFKQNPC